MTYHVGIKKLSDYIPELKEFERNGFLFTEAGGDETGIYFEFIKRSLENNFEISGRISINYDEYGKTQKDLKEILEDELGSIYDKNGK
jgi:hypothetical protein